MTMQPHVSGEEIQLFLEELEEQVQTLEEGFLSLEKGGADAETLNACFRAAHTVKGSSAAIGHQQMAALTHAMENVLDLMRKGELAPGRRVMDVLFAGLDSLRALKGALTEGWEAQVDVAAVLKDLRDVAAGRGEAPALATGEGSALPPEVLDSLRRGLAEGLVPLQVTAFLAPDSIMPAVRAYQIFLALNEVGEVAWSRPTIDEIEAEEVGTEVTFWLLTAEARETVRNAVAGVTDVVKVEIALLDADRLLRGAGLAPAPGTPAGTAPGETAAGEEGAASGGARAGGLAVPEPRTVQAAGESRTVRVDVAILDNLMNLIGELVIDRTRVGQLSAQLAAVPGVEELAGEISRISNHLARITGFLQDEILKARMLPIDRLFKKFPRMVRDLEQKFGKPINFVVRGEDTELDRAVIEVLGDPLIHLLRNAIDHGIESPEEREAAGKPRAGTVVLAAYHSDNQIVVEVSDDGRGIDPELIREVAVAKGIISRERARELSERDAYMLIFAPGFSTAREVSEISGRGVGMDVVRKNIERVNGRVEVESRVGEGTTFRIFLPLTLATIRALLVRTAGQTFALPLSAIVETMRVDRSRIQLVRGQEVVIVRDRVVPIKRLDEYLGMSGGSEPDKGSYAVLVNAAGATVGLIVDSLLGEQEIVIKSLGRFIGDVPGLAGATILGDGSVALILDVRGLHEAVWERTEVQAAGR